MGALHFAAESQECSRLILLPPSISPNRLAINFLRKPQTQQLVPAMYFGYMSCSCNRGSLCIFTQPREHFHNATTEKPNPSASV